MSNVSTQPIEADPKARDLLRIVFVALTALVVEICVGGRMPGFIGIIATLVGGWPVFSDALRNLRERRMTMELSMTIAILAALSIGEFATALAILFFVLAAEILEGLTVGRGRRAIKDLLDLVSRRTVVVREGQPLDVETDEVQAGDHVVVNPGARVPVDGLVVRGHSFVDQASITGESLPVEKVPGAEVYAGTINQSGTLEVRTTRVGRDTAFGKIIESVERAERSRAPIQKTADRLAGYIVYFALGCAALTFIITRDMRSTISVVIVAGACGIASGTPLAILGAIGRAARQGVIIKGGIHLETLASIDTVLLDKTGTLTYGQPEIIGVHPAPGVSRRILLGSAAIAERPSEHPLGRAILKRAAEESLPTVEPDEFSYIPGKGIVCSVGGEEIVVGTGILLAERRITTGADLEILDPASQVLVARGGRFLGTLRFEDVLRPGVGEAVRELQSMGIWTVLLSGDDRRIADHVGRSLGVNEIAAELLPDRKLERVRALVAEGRRVAMVGDGINDAPALASASVGVAMGSGTEVAQESANIVLLGDDLQKFVEVVRLARRCRRIIMTNFSGTLLLDGLGVALAAVGMLSPVVAAFIHVSSEIAFILNSARMLPSRQRDTLTATTVP
ncbi:MAG TPA: cation-translocating P-type ATPase [Candidatus Polarisedimenticolia bacterium]